MFGKCWEHSENHLKFLIFSYEKWRLRSKYKNLFEPITFENTYNNLSKLISKVHSIIFQFNFIHFYLIYMICSLNFLKHFQTICCPHWKYVLLKNYRKNILYHVPNVKSPSFHSILIKLFLQFHFGICGMKAVCKFNQIKRKNSGLFLLVFLHWFFSSVLFRLITNTFTFFSVSIVIKNKKLWWSRDETFVLMTKNLTKISQNSKNHN